MRNSSRRLHSAGLVIVLFAVANRAVVTFRSIRSMPRQPALGVTLPLFILIFVLVASACWSAASPPGSGSTSGGRGRGAPRPRRASCRAARTAEPERSAGAAERGRRSPCRRRREPAMPRLVRLGRDIDRVLTAEPGRGARRGVPRRHGGSGQDHHIDRRSRPAAGKLLLMPAWTAVRRAVHRLKIVKVFPDNAKAGEPAVSASIS